MTTNPISHVSVGAAINQSEFEQANGHDLDGDFNLGVNLLVGNGGPAGIAISANGEVTMTSQPAVLAHNSVDDANVTGNGTTATVDLDTEIFDQNGDFTADTFTAPVTGRYFITGHALLSQVTTASNEIKLEIVASNRTIRFQDTTGVAANGAVGAQISCLVDMDAGDTITITVQMSGEASDVVDLLGGTGGNQGRTMFSAYLVA